MFLFQSSLFGYVSFHQVAASLPLTMQYPIKIWKDILNFCRIFDYSKELKPISHLATRVCKSNIIEFLFEIESWWNTSSTEKMDNDYQQFISPLLLIIVVRWFYLYFSTNPVELHSAKKHLWSWKCYSAFAIKLIVALNSFTINLSY